MQLGVYCHCNIIVWASVLKVNVSWTMQNTIATTFNSFQYWIKSASVHKLQPLSCKLWQNQISKNSGCKQIRIYGVKPITSHICQTELYLLSASAILAHVRSAAITRMYTIWYSRQNCKSVYSCSRASFAGGQDGIALKISNIRGKHKASHQKQSGTGVKAFFAIKMDIFANMFSTFSQGHTPNSLVGGGEALALTLNTAFGCVWAQSSHIIAPIKRFRRNDTPGCQSAHVTITAMLLWQVTKLETTYNTPHLQ